MKVLAMYLPQFHRVKENDQWWGEGFTEWEAVKSAEKLFDMHYQPRIPQNYNYYDLLDKDTMLWQAALMKKYSVDGMCMYHYWFKDGRKILEKPAENLLKWTDVQMPFCFCWANETWARSWSLIQNKNVWSSIHEQEDIISGGVLLEQRYGHELQWKQHFEYLLPFFKDERYIKVEGKPLFLIYKTAEISCMPEMIDYWQELACLHGLKGLYIVGSACYTNRGKGLDAELYYEPADALGSMAESCRNDRETVSAWEYDEFWKNILSKEDLKNIYFEGVVGYDDTPRRGREGNIVLHAAPEKFSHYFTELMAKSAAYGNDIVFLNAWNEWGEGMYLEPDEKYREKFLEAIPYAKKHYKNIIEKYKNRRDSFRLQDENMEQVLKRELGKNVNILHIMEEWMKLQVKDISLAHRLKAAGYKEVAIYGYGILGRSLYEELADSDVEVKYMIDRKGEKIRTGVKIYLPSENLPEVDAVIVSAVFEYGVIYRYLKDKGISNVLSLERLIYEQELG